MGKEVGDLVDQDFRQLTIRRCVGMERVQLETLGLSGGNISDYVSGINNRRFENTGKLKTKPGLTLIDCSDFDRHNQRNLDRAA